MAAHGEYNHIEIPFDDAERAKRFYGGVFGWQFSETPGFEGYPLYTAGPGGLGGGLGKRGEMAGQTVRNYISVDDIDAAIAKVKELGGTITEGRSEIPGMGWFAVGTDTEGNVLALYKGNEG
ncbi:MAG: VOC family protein [Chloroflexi bacterium]|nr:VOC family protein [Chloroflexota bacterium]